MARRRDRRHQSPPHAPSPAVATAPAPTEPSLRADRVPPGCASEPRQVDRQHPAAPSRNPAPASTRPVDTPGSARFVLHRRADRPPNRHRPNRIRRIGGISVLLWPAQSGSAVRAALSPLSAAPSALGRLDSALNPALGGPCRRLSRPPAAAQAARQPPASTPQGPPAWPPATPAQFPAPPAGVRITAFAPVWLSVTCERRKGWNSKVGPRDPWRVPYRMN